MPFEPWHLEWLSVPQPIALTMEYGQMLSSAGPAYSAFAGSTVVACAGVVQFWQGRSQAWALISEHMPRYQKSVHKAVKKFLQFYQVKRLECVVDPRHDAAIRWAERLGFESESVMPSYTPNGDLQLMMVRLQPWLR